MGGKQYGRVRRGLYVRSVRKMKPKLRRKLPKEKRFFPYSNVMEKSVKYVWKEVVPKDFWNRQLNIAEWRKEDAEELCRMLKPLEGQYVILYGGNVFSSFPVEYWVCRLEKVKVDRPTYYDKPKPYKPKDKYIVVARLKADKKGSLPLNKKVFELHLGSWKIARIIPEKEE